MKEYNGTVVSINSESIHGHGRKLGKANDHTIKSYGECIDYIIQNDGKLYAVNEDEGAVSRIDFDPYTGRPAHVKQNQSPIEKIATRIRDEMLAFSEEMNVLLRNGTFYICAYDGLKKRAHVLVVLPDIELLDNASRKYMISTEEFYYEFRLVEASLFYSELKHKESEVVASYFQTR